MYGYTIIKSYVHAIKNTSKYLKAMKFIDFKNKNNSLTNTKALG